MTEFKGTQTWHERPSQKHWGVADMAKILILESCADCPHHKVLPDPDPDDSFCFDDVKVVCGDVGGASLPRSSNGKAPGLYPGNAGSIPARGFLCSSTRTVELTDLRKFQQNFP